MNSVITNRVSDLYIQGGIMELALGGWREFWLKAYTYAPNKYNNTGMLEKYTWARYLESKYYMNNLLKMGFGNNIMNHNIKKWKSSDTVFILGSGTSIDNITEKHWEHIADKDSIGLNKWPFHEFTPTYHVFELPRIEKKYQNCHWYWELLDYRKESYSNIPVIMKDVSRTYYDIEPDSIPDWICENILLLPKIQLPGENVRFPDVWFRQINDTNFFDDEIRYIYQNNASLMFLILLSVKLGYDSIVLSGVDLNNSRHFFEDSRYEDIIDHPNSSSRDKNKKHKTASKNEKKFTIMDIINSMNRLILKPRGISLYIENKNSALYPDLPHYDITMK